MPSTVQKAGKYKAVPYGRELVETQSGAVGVRVYYMLTHILDESLGEWSDLHEQPTAEGTVWIVRKDGTQNERAVKDLFYVLGWSGDLKHIPILAAWKMKPCEVTVESETWNGKERFKVAWINEPGSKGNGTEIAERVMGSHGAAFGRIIAEAAAARGLAVEPFDAVIHSTVPLGGGLSSSAALEVAMATLLEAMCGEPLDPLD